MAKDKKTKASLLKEKRKSSRVTGEKEKRYYIRIDVSVPMALSIKNKGNAEIVRAYAKNISASGIMVELEKKLSIGTDADIDMSAPDALNPIHCSGKVIRVAASDRPGRYNCGIVFTRIEEDNKNTFLKFLCDTIYRAGAG